jgi:hypothetical protein
VDVTIKVSINTDDTRDQVSWKIAGGVSDLLRSLDHEVDPRGISAKVSEPGSVVHLDVKED